MTSESDWKRSILPFTLHYEGGWSDDRNDPGNWTGGKVGVGELKGTKYGIACSAHPDIEIKSLTIDAASDIYWNQYVRARHFDSLDLPMLCVVFDSAVNCGPAEASKWLIEAEKGGQAVHDQILSFSRLNLSYHMHLKTWPRYGRGWGTRIAACQKQALLLASIAPTPLTMHAWLPSESTPRIAPQAKSQPKGGIVRSIVNKVLPLAK